MKKYIIYILCISLFSAFLTSCSEDSLSSTSSITDKIGVPNEFDKWIVANYTIPYNINFKYRFEDIESDMNYNLEAADPKKAIRMAKMVQHLTLGTYDEYTGSRKFLRSYYPKILFMVGSPGYKNNGTVVLATAEGGYKITLNWVNSMPLTQLTAADFYLLNRNFFKTLHHEFAHILHQTTPYSISFNKISGPDYVQDKWNETYPDNETGHLPDGFITPYASSAVDEDFVELYSEYITSTKADWDQRIVTAGDGAKIINQKLEIVRKYMKETWALDMDKLREIVLRRQTEVLDLDLDTLN